MKGKILTLSQSPRRLASTKRKKNGECNRATENMMVNHTRTVFEWSGKQLLEVSLTIIDSVFQSWEID